MFIVVRGIVKALYRRVEDLEARLSKNSYSSSKSASSDGLSKKPTMSAAAKLASAAYSWRGITARLVQEICVKALDKPGT